MDSSDMNGNGKGKGDGVVERAHGLYREGKHEEALRLYSEALKDLEEEKKTKKTTMMALHSNRAACFLKMRRFRQAAEECSAVLELEPDHPGALMLRAQTLVTLRDYQSALFDVTRLLHISPDCPLYHDLHARLKTQLSLAPIPESDEEQQEEDADHQLYQTPPPIPIPIQSTISPSPTTPTPTTNAWHAIPKPKGHSGLDYSRWDQVQDASSGDDDSDGDDDDNDDDEAGQPQYRFRLRTVSMRPVK